MFNEGVDIPSLDMVMFLRPTESPVVFLQQLGRGLRKEAGKEYLTVLDSWEIMKSRECAVSSQRGALFQRGGGEEGAEGFWFSSGLCCGL